MTNKKKNIQIFDQIGLSHFLSYVCVQLPHEPLEHQQHTAGLSHYTVNWFVLMQMKFVFKCENLVLNEFCQSLQV